MTPARLRIDHRVTTLAHASNENLGPSGVPLCGQWHRCERCLRQLAVEGLELLWQAQQRLVANDEMARTQTT